MNFKAYGKSKDTPNRKIRKGSRCSVFLFNKKINRIRRKENRLARRIVE